MARRSLAERFDALAPRLRIGPLRAGAFTSRLHTERLAAMLGLALGISFGVCFLTGLLSHLIQQPPSWFLWPSRPAGLYRVTQGIHVTTGIASIPLLFAKLWTVYPKLWRWPPLEDAAHAIERISLLPLVGGATFIVRSRARRWSVNLGKSPDLSAGWLYRPAKPPASTA